MEKNSTGKARERLNYYCGFPKDKTEASACSRPNLQGGGREGLRSETQAENEPPWNEGERSEENLGFGNKQVLPVK